MTRLIYLFIVWVIGKFGVKAAKIIISLTVFSSYLTLLTLIISTILTVYQMTKTSLEMIYQSPLFGSTAVAYMDCLGILQVIQELSPVYFSYLALSFSFYMSIMALNVVKQYKKITGEIL